MTESPELAAAQPLLDAAKDRGFTVERIAVGEDAPLRGVWESGPARWALSPLDCPAHLLVRDHPPGVLTPRCGEVPPTVALLRSGRSSGSPGVSAVSGHHPRAGDPISGWPPVELSPTPRSRRPAGPFLRPTNPPVSFWPPVQPAGRDTIPAPRVRNEVTHD
ncbi:MAG: hypothetical protein ACRDQ4_25160 [Pseudonocardiaceae bacterium]